MVVDCSQREKSRISAPQVQLVADRRCTTARAVGSPVTANGAAPDDAARSSASYDAVAGLSTVTHVSSVADDAGLPSVANGIPSATDVPLAANAARLPPVADVPPATHGHGLSNSRIPAAAAWVPNATSSAEPSLSGQSLAEGWERYFLLPKVPSATYSRP